MKFTTPLLFIIGALNAALLIGVIVFYPLELRIPFIRSGFLSRSDASVPQTDKPVKEEDEPGVSLLFTGDIMMARNVEAYIAANGQDYPFKKIGDLLSGTDLLIGNFEGTVREKEHIEGTNEMSFDTTPKNLQILVDQGFDLLSLSNNHADDFGPDVTSLTRQFIEAYGISAFGDAVASGNFVSHKTVKNETFAFIGYHAFGETADSLTETIKKEKAAGNFVIMYPHWGNEYEVTPSPAQTEAARLFIDAGADAVIGSHPHVVQTVETYKGKPIIYSLGNFLFDQDWSEATKTGLVVKMTVTNNAIAFQFIPLSIQKRQMSAASEAVAKPILERLGFPSGTFLLSR
jgi:poly-gamma-glutamate capsule biosynthesis protein CapA/YwtB (metallophosphatase superfamily)